MPSLAEAGKAASDLDHRKYIPAEPAGPPHHSVPSPVPIFMQPGMFLRCPMPFIPASPDSLRQFYREGVPLTRVTPLAQLK